MRVMLHPDRRAILAAFAGAGTAALLIATPFGTAFSAVSSAIFTARNLGIRSNGRDDDSLSLQTAIERISRAGGGELQLTRGAVTIARVAPVILDNVSLDLNGGTLALLLSDTNATGVRLRSGATLRNGIISVRSSGVPSLQGAAHAPVVVGPLYGEGGTPGRVSSNEGVSGWTIKDLTLSSDKDAEVGGGRRVGAAAIAIMGNSHHGLIENIRVPDSPYMLGGIHMDWGTVGPIRSDSIPANRALFQASRAYTSHPHNIVVRNIRIGRLTRPLSASGGSFGIRLSGVHDIEVSDVSIESVTEAAFYHTAGDLGFEFAKAETKPLACKGIRFSRGQVRDGASAYLIWTDSYADNISRARANGYRPMLDPIHPTDLVFEKIVGVADPSRANFGIRINHQRGGRIIDCVADGFKRGFYIDEQVDGLVLVRPVAINSAEHGISVEHPSRPPRNIVIDNPQTRGNGRGPGSGAASGVLIGRSESVVVTAGEAPIDPTQKSAIRIMPEALNARIR